MKLDRTLAIVKRYKASIENMVDNTMRFEWTHSFYLEGRKEMLGESAYRHLPTWAKEYLRGWEDALMQVLWRGVVFAYEYRGKRLAITSDEYHKISPRVIHDECGHNGCYVWRSNHNKMWTKPKSETLRPTRP